MTALLLDDKAAVITGAAQGIGFSIAERFVSDGARVVTGDIDLDAARTATARLGGGAVAIGVRCDVTSADEVHAMLDAAAAAFSPVNVMVNNAGITRDATVRKMTEEMFYQVIDVHLKGTWNGTRLAGAVMRDNGGGTIVNMSLLSGKIGLAGPTNSVAGEDSADNGLFAVLFHDRFQPSRGPTLPDQIPGTRPRDHAVHRCSVDRRHSGERNRSHRPFPQLDPAIRIR